VQNPGRTEVIHRSFLLGFDLDLNRGPGAVAVAEPDEDDEELACQPFKMGRSSRTSMWPGRTGGLRCQTIRLMGRIVIQPAVIQPAVTPVPFRVTEECAVTRPERSKPVREPISGVRLRHQ
jgi:hypothetical protein